MYYHEHEADGGEGELGAKQPLPPPLAALRDAIVADAAVLRAKIDELQDVVEVQLLVALNLSLSLGTQTLCSHDISQQCLLLLMIILSWLVSWSCG